MQQSHAENGACYVLIRPISTEHADSDIAAPRPAHLFDNIGHTELCGYACNTNTQNQKSKIREGGRGGGGM